MRKFFAGLVALSFIYTGCKKEETLTVKQGKVEEFTVNVPSSWLISNPKALVYLPPDYDPNKKYPVVYMLHGFGGDYRTYVYYNGINEVLDYLISTGQIDPVIVVMPDGRNPVGGSFYTDSKLYEPGMGPTFPFMRYESYIIDSLMSQVEGAYPIDTTRRAIMGLSMGSYGSAKLWLKHPEKFVAVALHSGPLAFDSLINADVIDSMLNEFPDRRLPLWIKDYLGIERVWTTLGNGLSFAFTPRMVDYQDPTDWRVIENCFYSGGLNADSGDVLLDTLTFSGVKKCLGVRFPIVYADSASNSYIPSCLTGAFPDNTTYRMLSEDYCTWKVYHDPQTLIDSALTTDANAFKSTKVYIDVGVKDELTLLSHNRGFKQTLLDKGFPRENLVYVEFDGKLGYPSEDFPGRHSNWIRFRMKKSLIFINRVFRGENVNAGDYYPARGEKDYE